MFKHRALFGGTFDPVHVGHLRIGIDLRDQLGFDQVHMIPCHLPSHRGQPAACSQVRLDWLNQSLTEEKSIVADNIEIQREGPSYTIDTIQVFREKYPDDGLTWVIGADSLLTLNLWQGWRQFLDYANLLVVPRPGIDDLEAIWLECDELKSQFESKKISLAQDLRKFRCGYFALAQNIRPLAVSSTQIRALINQHSSIRYLVPDSIRSNVEASYKK